ncbi:DUF4230 domain-containing protein [Luteolibacter ambystomatis]|uniref:DUF4230 domain-containing protein n=1 Tax=Luteolibacter ambystomatis TaxID=2824561 RepID=A0A975G8P9_9BACT|nr:DUF4230 domain-containing protein [Luteolibacter ambystomatis]QUE50872.1 DUF4230 domain-containing protein [Luteolibacter ambystomatis]
MPHRVEMWRTLRWLGIAAVLTVALYLFVLRPFERAAAGASATLEHSLDKVLAAVTNSNTRVVEGRAEIAETSEITELSLLEMRMSATRSFEKEDFMLKYFPLGTKKVILRGHYRVKAGYKLKPGVSLRIEKGEPVASFPRAEILSVELIDFDVLNEENGWLNKVTPVDRAAVLRELREQMRQEAERSGILETAESTLKTRLRDLLGTDSVRVERQER